ncbi:MAG: hypothetical protein QW802_04340 [Candidatus Altiarchaeota archaeon]
MLVVSAQLEGEILGAKWSWVICNILCLILFISAAILSIVIALAGIKLISSESSMQKNEAKKRIIYGIIGLFVVILSVAVINYLLSSISTDVKQFNCSCTDIWKNDSTLPYSNASSEMKVEIIYPGDGSELEEDLDIQFLGYVYQGTPDFEYSWSSTPSGISRKVSKAYSMDSFSAKLERGEYTITLTVVDASGKTSSDSVKIKVIIPKPPVKQI